MDQIAGTLTSYSFGTLAAGVIDRVFAVLYHTGASILVFYACRDKQEA